MKKQEQKGGFVRHGRSWIYTVVVVLLVLSAYAQIYMVFGTSTGTVLEKSDSGTQKEVSANLLTPSDMYASLGGSGERMYVHEGPEDADFADMFDLSYALLLKTAQNADFEKVPVEELPWDRAALVMTYAFSMDEKALVSQLTLSEEEVPEGSFDQLWVVPSCEYGQEVALYFYDTASQSVICACGGSYSWEENQAFLSAVQTSCTSKAKRYVEVSKAYGDGLEYAGFVPEVSYRQSGVRGKAQSFFTEDGQENASQKMDAYAQSYFDYPETVARQEEDNACIYSNEKISLLLTAGGYMQYMETLTDDEKEGSGMKQAYQTALDFLEGEFSKTGETALGYELCGYEVSTSGSAGNESTSYTFSFHYRLNGSTLRMERNKSVAWGMKAPAVVTVVGSKVRSCQRYVLHVAVEEDSSYTLVQNWMDAANLMARNWSLTEVPHMVYYISEGSLVLEWEADTRQGLTWISAG